MEFRRKGKPAITKHHFHIKRRINKRDYKRIKRRRFNAKIDRLGEERIKKMYY